MKKICIVTTRHISYNPRVLKEADTLQDHGYAVSVVTVNSHPVLAEFDRQLMRTRKWTLKTVNFRRGFAGENALWLYLSIKQRLFAGLSGLTVRAGVAERAAEKAYHPLKRLAIRERADLYLVHHPEALGIGYAAARINKARFGFDAEDFHTGMTESSVPSHDDRLVEYLERKYLPVCDYLTAASAGIARAYRDKYGIRMPEVLLNVFPRVSLKTEAVNSPVRFYWYSQVVGPNRGLEGLLEAAGRLHEPFELHLRGSWHNDEYRISLQQQAERWGLGGKIFYHEPINADLLIPDGNRFDIGLALESDVSLNRKICVTNKVFSYLMSGMAIIGTDTEGQKDIFSYFPEAVRPCRIDDAASLADAMRFFLSNTARLLAARKAALRAAETFCWENESQKLLAYVAQTMEA